VDQLVRCARERPLTLVYAARDEARNNAVALREVIVRRLSHGRRSNPRRRSA
jgi:uncharacterized protein YeaO (DUF488 family)